jgi:DNA-binding SARP family transcriptional activator
MVVRTSIRTMHLSLATSARYAGPAGDAVDLAARDAALLAYLAIEGPTTRLRMVELLWPESTRDDGLNALRQRLFQLRRHLRAVLVDGQATLALAEGVSHDLLESSQVLGDALHEHSPAFAVWLSGQRARRSNRVQRSLVESSEAAERAGDYGAALMHAVEVVAREPFSESAHRRVMRLHYLNGDRSAALLAFDGCERMLKEEVGGRPSAETLALLATVERAAPGPALRPAGWLPAALQRPPQLVGRDAQCVAIGRAVHDGTVVLLVGQAGTGKSRLISELRDGRIAAAGAQWLSVGARPGDLAAPYAVIARWLRALLQRPGVRPSATQRRELARVLPEFGPVTIPAREGDRRTTSAMQALLQQAVAQGLNGVVIDDLQFADAASVELLRPLIGEGGCGWIVAMRSDELDAAAQALVDAQMRSARAQTVPLQPLDVAGVGALLDSLAIEGIGGAAQAEALHQRTGGNPLFLLETLKAALASRADGAPAPGDGGSDRTTAIAWPRADSVQLLIEQRLRRLSPLALKLARCAALAGQDLSPALAAEVLGLRPLDLADAWAELEAAQVLRDGTFAHDLVAEAALALVPNAIASALHAEIAGVLERNRGVPARIAAHLLSANEPLKAAPHLMDAARRAHAAWQRSKAATLHEQAAVILREAGDRRGAFDAYFAAAEAASQTVGKAGLARLGQALIELADDDGQRAAAALVPALQLLEAREIDAARTLVLEALPRAQRAGMADVEVELLWDLVLLHMDRRELAEAARRAEQALERLESVDPATARLSQLGTRFKLTSILGTTLSATGHYAQGDAKLLQALQQTRQDGEWAYTGFVANGLAVNALEQGSLERALDWSAQSIADEDRYDGGTHERVSVASSRAILLALGGDLGGALALAERAVQLCGAAVLRIELRTRQRLHALQFELGRRDLALKGLRALRGGVGMQAHELALLEADLLRAGEPVDAATLLDQAVRLDDFPLRVRILCLSQPGCDPERILPLLSMSAATARDQGAHGLWLTLQTRRVAALRALGRGSEAREQALAVWQRVEEGVAGLEIFPRMAAELCAALAHTDVDLMQVIALRASAWMHRAAATLPAGWRENYLMRAPMLQALPPAARGLLLAPPS